jgi:hypothetical protein
MHGSTIKVFLEKGNLMMYSSTVESVLIYGAKTWSLYEDGNRRINAAEMDA